jgi:hypothetical protein
MQLQVFRIGVGDPAGLEELNRFLRELTGDLSLYRGLMGDLSLCQASSVSGRTWSIVAGPMRRVT